MKMIEQIAESEKRMIEIIDNFEIRQDEKIAKLAETIMESKAEILKWMFIFWLGNIITIIGGIIGILKIAKVF